MEIICEGLDIEEKQAMHPSPNEFQLPRHALTIISLGSRVTSPNCDECVELRFS